MTDQQQGGLHYNKTSHWEESLKKVHLVHKQHFVTKTTEK